MNRILIIEDDRSFLEALSDSLLKCGFSVDTAENADVAIHKAQSQQYEVILSDVQLHHVDGITLVNTIKQYLPTASIIMMTAYGTIQDAVLAIQQGANDYISKPFEIPKLKKKIDNFLSQQHKGNMDIPDVDSKMLEIYHLAEKVAVSDATVLLMGESGTGKEVLSKFIHEHSSRHDKPFVAINCAAIPDNMLEAMLFGYEKGAFTGAHRTSEGKFEQANGGTLLLDEISEMPIHLQAKLLRVLQEKEVEKLGSKKSIPLDVRVIATTNKNLKEAVKKGEFRKDLYFRLNVFPINLPPLRERGSDILLLTHQLLNKHTNEEYQIESEAEDKLLSYHWPGNVRELENIIQRAAILSPERIIKAEHIIFDSLSDKPPVPDNESLQDRKEHAEFYMILEVLESFNGNRKQASEKLGISPRTLRYKLAKMKELGMNVPT